MAETLKRLQELDAKATPGPWTVEYNDGYMTGHIISDKHTYAGNSVSRVDSITGENSMTTIDAEFIATLVNWWRNRGRAALARRDALLRECLRDLTPKPNRYMGDLIDRIERELGDFHD